MGKPPAERDLTLIASDPDAFEAFYRWNVDAVRLFVVRRVDDPHLAADLITEVFLAAIDSVNRYSPSRGTPTQWLHGIARNTVAAERRRSAKERRATSRISGRALLDEDDIADLIDRIDAETQSRQLYEAMDRLDDDDRGLLELVAIDGLSVREASDILGMSHVSARVRLHRTRRGLRKQLATSITRGIEMSQTIVEEVHP